MKVFVPHGFLRAKAAPTRELQAREGVRHHHHWANLASVDLPASLSQIEYADVDIAFDQVSDHGADAVVSHYLRSPSRRAWRT